MTFLASRLHTIVCMCVCTRVPDGEIQAAPAEEGGAKEEEGKEEGKDSDEEVKAKPKAPKKKVSNLYAL